MPRRSNAVPSVAADTNPTQRDRHLQQVAAYGRLGWQKSSGYNYRALVEVDISRLKHIIGDALRSRTDVRRATEVAIAARVLNRMLDLGQPEYVRLSISATKSSRRTSGPRSKRGETERRAH